MLIVKWPKVITKTIPFYGDINLGNVTLFRICSFKTSFGLHRKEGIFICIERASSGWIFQQKAFPDYVAEKLMMNRGDADVKIITDFINAQLGVETQQFGEYEEEYVLNNKEYGLMGERKQRPICPEIIKEENAR